MKQRCEKRNEGVALILTLLFVVLLTVLVVEFAPLINLRLAWAARAPLSVDWGRCRFVQCRCPHQLMIGSGLLYQSGLLLQA